MTDTPEIKDKLRRLTLPEMTGWPGWSRQFRAPKQEILPYVEIEPQTWMCRQCGTKNWATSPVDVEDVVTCWATTCLARFKVAG